ncbi:MAG: adenylate/guanylate cyclase domain-containing protein [Acidimicrobiaceae bacterium]|nr:adenylate/guanylate cyclase domain-containing protein [Acidimicrobiaceae bacterium]MXW77012.1 adenylate/guanylate cyclase domain-containing protein [Acidimicrobiaceae bacterium]MYA74267.1 adenylate/guanylate cyclase domain-containing protein [Acidimicrobiaceae bacterium]MYC43644.1 adenylate/guanylate cyclase domain-containing protein [Acidimicrobiaceae bacterium]MYD05675.1 adenylate/guanylate cyclase domain-containing protein [Acidimicrobiaceae bacterium]
MLGSSVKRPRWNRDSLPAGIITFLFTDVEGSSRLWEADAVTAAQSVEVHDALVRRIVDTSGGHIFGWAGDHFRAAFQDAQAAVEAAVSIQNELARTDWRSGPALRVRMGLHRGNATRRGNDYFGTVPNRTGRLEACASGGQILISSDVAEVIDLELLSLGHHRLRDVPQPMLIYQIGCQDFPSINLTHSSPETFRNSPTIGLVRELGQVLAAQMQRKALACCGSVINAVSCSANGFCRCCHFGSAWRFLSLDGHVGHNRGTGLGPCRGRRFDRTSRQDSCGVR